MRNPFAFGSVDFPRWKEVDNAKHHIQVGDRGPCRAILDGVRVRGDRRTRFCGGTRFPWRGRDIGGGWHGGGGWRGGGRGGGWHGGGWAGPAVVGGLAAGALLAAPYAYGYGPYGYGYGYGGCAGYQPMYDAYGNYIGQQLVRTC